MEQEKSKRIFFRRGENVSLVILEETDIETITHGINDEEITQYLEVAVPMSREDESEWLKKVNTNKEHGLTFGIWHNADTKLIGAMGLHNISWRDRVATTGAAIWNKEYHCRGFGSEAKQLLLAYAFNTLNLRKICSQVFEFNIPSISYSKRCGYHVEAVLKEHLYRNGRYWDQVCMAIFQDEWKKMEE